MIGGQDFVQREIADQNLLQSTGYKPTDAKWTEEAIRHCNERICHYAKLKKILEGEDASRESFPSAHKCNAE